MIEYFVRLTYGQPLMYLEPPHNEWVEVLTRRKTVTNGELEAVANLCREDIKQVIDPKTKVTRYEDHH